MSRLRAYGLSAALLAVIAWPATWDYGEDSFPLSPYPMFAKPRAEVARVYTVLGVDALGTRHPLSPALIGDSTWVNLAAHRVQNAIVAGDDATRALCRDVAERVANEGASELLTLEVVSESFHTVAYFQGQTRPHRRRVHAACEVPR